MTPHTRMDVETPRALSGASGDYSSRLPRAVPLKPGP